ncbi:hypothetical protein KIN20_006399 [Parelaphostrongylus tenuis]|uniref:Chromo domain-containing protein n=1 Tax=Parelaphostrongylus tenuis TaxID=148309 RepID=A0AAD5QKZ5_PARTN|nr:hypothetical protein KIN20_006399 [Parelaphostrongylus tenuis]
MEDCESPSNTESERDANSADVPQAAHSDNEVSGSSDEEPPAGENLSEEVYEVERILDHEDTDEGLFYLVRWKGFGEADDSWEPAENLSLAAKAISEYERSRKVPSKREKKAAGKTPKANSRKESVKKRTAPKSASKRRRPQKASSDISDSESKNSDRDKDNDSDYEESSKSKKSTLPASCRKRAMTEAVLRSYSPSTVKSHKSISFKTPLETTSPAKKALQLRQSSMKDEWKQRRLIAQERERIEEEDRRRLIQKRELVEKDGNTTSSCKRRRQEETSNLDKRENLKGENRVGFLFGTRPVPLSEKTSDNGAARTPANNDNIVDDRQQQQIFAIGKLGDGRIRVLIGTDAAKRVVSLRDAHDTNSWGLLQHILQYAVFE